MPINTTSKTILFTAAGLLFGFHVHTHPYSHDHPATGGHDLFNSIHFIENKGQWDRSAAFKAAIPGGEVYLTDEGLLYNFVSTEDLNRVYHGKAETDHNDMPASGSETIRCHAYRVNFEGAGTQASYRTDLLRPFYHNYFIGKDPASWAGSVRLFGQVTRSNVYEGIDLTMYGTDERSLKYDLVVSPGADPGQISLTFDGVVPELTTEGHLRLRTTVNEVIEHAPYTYQEIAGEKREVKSRYQLDQGRLRFIFPEGYDKRYKLVIDPSVIFATFSGGFDNGYHSHSTTYDLDGNTYAASTGYNGGWPVTTGAYQTSYYGRNIALIAKYSADGSSLLYATYFGGPGEGNMHPNTIRVNDRNELVVAGHTSNPDMPVTPGAYQDTMNGESDIYIARLSEDGTMLLSATYIGGSFREALLIGETTPYPHSGPSNNAINPVDIVFDKSGNLWVTSNTLSGDFPTTSQAHQPAPPPYDRRESVLFKMSYDLSSLLYSTYFGGHGWDGGIGLDYNSKDDVIGMVGYTESGDLYITPGAFMPASAGSGIDGFVLIMDNQTYQIRASSYVSTSGTDIVMRIAFDCEGNVYIAGRTTGNYPVTVNAPHVTDGYVFIDKLTSDLSTSLASIRTGARVGGIVPSALAVDLCGNVMITVIPSNTSQLHQPLTPDALIRTARPFYFAAFSSDFSQLLCGSYFGAQNDYIKPGTSRIDPATGILYHSVTTYANMGAYWPVTPNAYSPVYQSHTVDQVTFKISYDLTPLINTKQMSGGGANTDATHCVRGCKSAYLHYTNANKHAPPTTVKLQIGGDAVNGVDYQWIPDTLVIHPNQTTVLEIKPLPTSGPSSPDPKHVIINTLIPCGCEDAILSDTIWIYDSLYVEMLTPSDTVCTGTEVTIDAAIDPSLHFVWSPLDLIPDASGLSIRTVPDTTTTYRITVFQPGAPSTCPARTASYTVTVEPYPEISVHDTITCLRDSIELFLNVSPENIAYRYHWSPPEYLRNDRAGVNTFFAPPGEYLKRVTVSTPGAGCAASDSFMIRIVPPFRFDDIWPRDTVIRYGDSVQLYWEGEPVVWFWEPVRYFSSGAVRHPWAKPPHDIVYTLTGYDQYGCFDTADIRIRVDYNPNLNIPTAFTPNGDGKNDVFRIVNVRFEKLLHFSVWNRYGQLVFETKDPQRGWDGTIRGKPAEVGVYYYNVEMALPDGKYKQYKGEVTLIR